MPTNFASNATAPRILSTSAAKVVSASGSDMDGGMRIVEECLQDRLRRDLILRVAARLSAHAGRGERLAGRARGETLVDAGDRQAEAALELAREALGAGGHLVLGAVVGKRPPDHELQRSPFGDERRDRGEARSGRLRANGRQRMRDANHRVAYGDPDLARAEIESEDGAVAGGCWRRASRLTRARHRRTVGRNRCRAASSPP